MTVDQTPELKSLKAELEALKAHSLVDGSYIDPEEWPALTDDEIKIWEKQLAPYHLKSIGVFWAQDVEAQNLFRSLQTLGKDMHFDVTARMGQAGSNDIELIAQTNDPAAPVLQNLFKTLKCDVPLTYSKTMNPDYEGQISIYIGERPQATPPSSTSDKP